MSPRTIRSFVRRAGRMTQAQQRALDELWPRFGIEFSPALLDLDAVFGRRAPRVLEIGIGDGETLLELARTHPEADYLGVEVHEPGIGHCLLGIEAASLGNIRLLRHDAVEVLEHMIPDASLDEVLLYFADPWPKKRHHKRRIVQPEFVELLARRLKPGGVFRLATDWAPYAEHMMEVMATAQQFVPASPGHPRIDRARQPPRDQVRAPRPAPGA